MVMRTIKEVDSKRFDDPDYDGESEGKNYELEGADSKMSDDHLRACCSSISGSTFDTNSLRISIDDAIGKLVLTNTIKCGSHYLFSFTTS